MTFGFPKQLGGQRANLSPLFLSSSAVTPFKHFFFIVIQNVFTKISRCSLYIVRLRDRETICSRVRSHDYPVLKQSDKTPVM